MRESYDETLDALRQRFEQLEAAVAGFPPDLDEQGFSTAWYSDDPLERNRADSVLSSFEKTYMLLMDLIALSVKIARRLGAVSVEEGLPPVQTLREMKILSQDAEQALQVQRDLRNASQHVYVELNVSSLREAVEQQLESSPRIIQSITSWVDSLPEAVSEDRR